MNQVTVVYRAVEFPTEPADATVVMVVDANIGVDRDELRQQIERLHFGRDSAGQPFHQPYRSSESYHHTSWGADGATLEYIVLVASWAVSGIVGGAAWDGLRAIGQRIGSAHGPNVEKLRITQAMATQRAASMVVADLADINAADLTLLSVHITGDTATVIFQAPDGSTITAQPSFFDNGVIGSITRSYRPPSEDSGQTATDQDS